MYIHSSFNSNIMWIWIPPPLIEPQSTIFSWVSLIHYGFSIPRSKPDQTIPVYDISHVGVGDVCRLDFYPKDLRLLIKPMVHCQFFFTLAESIQTM